MLYLLKSYGPGDIVIYKVGYASNIQNRLKSYISSNPYIEKISESPGELCDEKILHLWLHSQISETRLNEWYLCESEEKMLDLFGRLSDAKDWVWDNRNKLGISLELWKYLYLPGKSLNREDYLLFQRSQGSVDLTGEPLDPEFLKIFLEPGHDFVERLRKYCDYRDTRSTELPEILGSTVIPKKYHEYYDLGRDTLSACSYQESKIRDYLETAGKIESANLRNAVLDKFSGIDRISKAEAKKMLSEIYKSLDIKKTAKATDLGEFYKIKEINMTISGKRQMGFKLEVIQEKEEG